MPRITVIIPTYNWSSVLPYSIGSVLRQTMTDWELLVIGDCCTDDSQEVVERINDPRVQWINLETNAGIQSGPNNEGLRLAKGDVIAYLGHDDLWLPHHLEVLLQAIESGADMAYSITEMVRITESVQLCTAYSCSPYRPGIWIPPTSVMHLRKSVIAVGGWRFPHELQGDPESNLWMRLHEAGRRIEFVPRMTCIKFPAAWRKDVYKKRPSGEQASWFDRIENEPNFEAAELTKILVGVNNNPDLRSLKTLTQEFRDTIKDRLQRRNKTMKEKRIGYKKALYDPRREFKGLDPH